MPPNYNWISSLLHLPHPQALLSGQSSSFCSFGLRSEGELYILEVFFVPNNNHPVGSEKILLQFLNQNSPQNFHLVLASPPDVPAAGGLLLGQALQAQQLRELIHGAVDDVIH